MTAVYLVLGLPGSGRHPIVANLIEDGLQEPRSVIVFHAADDPGPPNPDPKVTYAPYTFEGGQFTVETDKEPQDEPKEVFFIADGRKQVIDQIEAFPAWLLARGWQLTRILLVVDCALAAKHPEVVEWHDACMHFADCALLNNRNAETHVWAQQYQKKIHELRYPCQFFMVKNARVDNALVVLYPEARRMTLAFDEFDPIEDLELDDEELPDEPISLERKLDPYFERMPTGKRTKPVPNVLKFLGN